MLAGSIVMALHQHSRSMAWVLSELLNPELGRLNAELRESKCYIRGSSAHKAISPLYS